MRMREASSGMLTERPWKAILLFSIPLLIGNLFQQLYSMADAVLIGRLAGVMELAGVGATGAMSFLVIGFASGITGGFSVVTAQREGLKAQERVKNSVAASALLCLLITVCLTVVSVAAAEPLLKLMHTPEDIFPYALGYIRIIFAGLGATVYYNMTAGILRAVGDSRTPLYFLILASVLNILLDAAAIGWLRMGVEGAAAATVLSQLVSALLCHLCAWKRYPQFRPTRRHFARFFSEAYCHLRIGLPMAFQFFITAAGIMILQSYLNGFGPLVIAGYTAAGKVENLVTQPFTTLSVSMEVYCGQNFGAGRWDRIRQGVKSALVIGMISAVLAAVLNVCCGRRLIALFMEQENAEVVKYGYDYLLIITAFFWLLCTLQIIRSSLQGMGEAVIPMAGGAAELIARLTGCALLAAPLGYLGVYGATPLAWGLALVLLMGRYVWMNRREYSRDLCHRKRK